MAPKEKTPARNEQADALGKMLKKFGDTVSEIMEDPKLREKALEFSKSVVDAAAKFASTKIKDEDVRAKFADVGKAAQAFGKSVVDEFEPGKAKSKTKT